MKLNRQVQVNTYVWNKVFGYETNNKNVTDLERLIKHQGKPLRLAFLREKLFYALYIMERNFILRINF